MSEDIIKIRKKLIKEQKKKKPGFKRQDWFKRSMLDAWRRPIGRHSKQRLHECSKPRGPAIGYGTPAVIRGLHPSGYEDIIVNNINELRALDPKKQAARYAGSVGKKKRGEMNAEAEKLGVKVLNK